MIPDVHSRTAIQKSPGLPNDVQQHVHSNSNHSAQKLSKQTSGTRIQRDLQDGAQEMASDEACAQRAGTRTAHSHAQHACALLQQIVH